MWKKIVIMSFCTMIAFPINSWAQGASLNKAKYVTVLKVITDHKMNDEDIVDDVDKLRQHERFKKELTKMINKLNNSRPNEAQNRKIMRILERAGKDIYDELK